jgi:hypothetical protein
MDGNNDLCLGTNAPENADGWNRVLDVLGNGNVKLSLRTGGIDSRVLAHEAGWYGSLPGMIIGTNSQHAVSLATNRQVRFSVSWDGVSHVGTQTNPSDLLVWRDIYYQGSLHNFSDARLKHKIKPLTNALEELLLVEGVTFHWREPEKMGAHTGPQVGLIAQQVEKVHPEWVTQAPGGWKAIRMDGFPALATEALRELKTQLDSIEKRLAVFEKKKPSAARSPRKKPAKPEVDHESTSE